MRGSPFSYSLGKFRILVRILEQEIRSRDRQLSNAREDVEADPLQNVGHGIEGVRMWDTKLAGPCRCGEGHHYDMLAGQNRICRGRRCGVRREYLIMIGGGEGRHGWSAHHSALVNRI